MRKASPGILSLARRLMQTRAPSTEGRSETPAAAWKRAAEPLRLQLLHLVGGEGFQALLSRAVALAKPEFPWLEGVQIDTVGSLTALDEVLAGRDPAAGEAGGTSVLAHLLQLLVTLVGAELTRQLLLRAWPDTPVAASELDHEEDEV